MISDLGEPISDGTLRVCSLFQDQLSADMYSFVAKEIDYANYFQTVSVVKDRKYGVIRGAFNERVSMFSLLQLIETQAEYHRKSLDILHSILPQIKAHQGQCVSVCVCMHKMSHFNT